MIVQKLLLVSVFLICLCSTPTGVDKLSSVVILTLNSIAQTNCDSTTYFIYADGELASVLERHGTKVYSDTIFVGRGDILTCKYYNLCAAAWTVLGSKRVDADTIRWKLPR